MPRTANRRLCGLLAVAIACVAAADDGPVDRLRAIYEKSLQQIEADHQGLMRACLEKYGRMLDFAATRCQDSGNLEGLLEIKAEKTRLEKEQRVPDEPPGGASSLLIAIHALHLQDVSGAETGRFRAVLRLAGQYLRQLDSAKRALTKKGDIESAIAAKDEFSRVRSSSLVTTALFAVGQPSEDSDSVPEGDVATTVTTMTGCTKCGGTGRLVACTKCRGSGLCLICQGKGKVEPADASALIPCPSCKGGLCGPCKGSGQTEAKCPVCDGSGKIPITVARAIDPGTADPTPAERPPTPAVKTPETPTETKRPPPSRPVSPDRNISEFEAQLNEYVNTMTSLYDTYRTKGPEGAGFEAVQKDTESYVGRVLRSEVYLVSAFAREVRVVPTNGRGAKDGRLVPHSLKVGLVADKLFRAGGKGHKVAITYGVVNENSLTLFNIAAAGE